MGLGTCCGWALALELEVFVDISHGALFWKPQETNLMGTQDCSLPLGLPQGLSLAKESAPCPTLPRPL